MLDLDGLLSLGEFREAARAGLTREAFDYFDGGAGDGITTTEAHGAWQSLRLRPRVLRGVAARSAATTVLGAALEWPVFVAPMAFQRLACADGEVATARAAAATGAGMILSTLATAAMSEVRAATAGPLWFQLYVYRDREATRDLVTRAELAGYTALVLTVDAPLLGRRERDVRNGFRLPDGLTIGNPVSNGPDTLPVTDAGSALAHFVDTLLEPGLTWDDVTWLRSITRLPIIVKGILRGDDARLAVDHGAEGIVVSTHGGRQLDTVVSSPVALREVADEVRGSAAILVDGGIERGTDVLKALALGANAVLVGRPVLWGLAVGGTAGAQRVLQLLRDEFDLAMALAGCRSIDEITPDLIAP